MKFISSTKKAFALLFTGVMAASVVSLPVVANAASPVLLSVSSAKGAVGADVVISLNISANSGLSAATALLKYDNTKLTCKSSVAGKAAEGALASINPKFGVEGDFTTINCSVIHATGLNAAGSLMDVTFTIKSGWNGSTPLTLTVTDFADAQYKKISYSVENGSLTVTTSATTKTTVPASTVSTTIKETGTQKTTVAEPESTTNATGTTVAVETTVEDATVIATDVSTSLVNEESTTKALNVAENDNSSSSKNTIIIIVAVSAVLIVAAFVIFVVRKKK